MTPASFLLLLPVLPVVLALVLLLTGEGTRRRAALSVGLVAGLSGDWRDRLAQRGAGSNQSSTSPPE